MVTRAEPDFPLPAWSANLERRAASIRDFVDEELFSLDFVEGSAALPYVAGEYMQLQHTTRCQKLLPAFEKGRQVRKVLSPSTVVVHHRSSQAEKVINIDLLKPDVDMPEVTPTSVVDNDMPVYFDHNDEKDAEDEGVPQRYALRRREAIQVPSRYA